ncbi:hypothetical protein COOONC_07123 [Cooperia oncophora]
MGGNKITIGIPPLPSGILIDYLCGSEIESAAKFIIKNHQGLNVTNDIRKALKDLNIQKDKEGRAPGKSRPNYKILDKVPHLIFRKSHTSRKSLFRRAGINPLAATMSLIRQQFWISQLRSQVKGLNNPQPERTSNIQISIRRAFISTVNLFVDR